LPLHSPSGGYNTPEARDVSVIAAAIALGMQLASQFKERFCDVDHPRFSPVAVQLVIGDAVHEFAPGGIGPNSPAMFRFYLGIAFRDKD
jgi:hypothetical protein